MESLNLICSIRNQTQTSAQTQFLLVLVTVLLSQLGHASDGVRLYGLDRSLGLDISIDYSLDHKVFDFENTTTIAFLNSSGDSIRMSYNSDSSGDDSNGYVCDLNATKLSCIFLTRAIVPSCMFGEVALCEDTIELKKPDEFLVSFEIFYDDTTWQTMKSFNGTMKNLKSNEVIDLEFGNHERDLQH